MSKQQRKCALCGQARAGMALGDQWVCDFCRGRLFGGPDDTQAAPTETPPAQTPKKARASGQRPWWQVWRV